ncbi:hypothetical protein J6590_004212 [Homalodisca vitripennis]|nr:hypothetical protein J6590_004212 [Homalodisca vitripennis]
MRSSNCLKDLKLPSLEWRGNWGMRSALGTMIEFVVQFGVYESTFGSQKLQKSNASRGGGNGDLLQSSNVSKMRLRI